MMRIMLRLSGLWVGESGGRQAWVPASYFKDLSPIPTTVEAIADPFPKDSQERESGKKLETPSMSSEIDDFSRAFHDAITQSEDIKALREKIGSMRQSSLSRNYSVKKPRYQLVDEVVRETAKSPTMLERALAQKRSSMPKLAISKTTSEEENVSNPTVPVETRSRTPPQLNRKFSWEAETQGETVSTAPIQTVPEFVRLPPIKVLNRESSWSNDDTASTPSLVRSSTTSSSSTSSASSYTSASSSVSAGTLLKFDPISKDLIIVGSNPTSPLSEFQGQSLDDFLESLSANILDRRSKKLSTKTLPPVAKSNVKVKPDIEPSSDDTRVAGGVKLFIRPKDIYHRIQTPRESEDGTKGSSTKILPQPSENAVKGERNGQASSLAAKEPSEPQAKFLASEKGKALPALRPTDVFMEMMEREELELKKDFVIRKEAESALNRSHPLRSKERRNRKNKGDKQVL